MKTIKIMIAASEEMHEEKLEFTNLIEHLNEVLEPRGIELKRVKWNPETDGSIEDFKTKLKDCEMCLTLYWRDMAGNSEQELDTAYSELKEGNNPRNIYVFFKEPTEDLTESLRSFKTNFVTNYGHFFCKFENVDTMNLHFILQFEAYQNRLQSNDDKLIKVTGGKVTVANKEFVNLNKVPFAALNIEYQRLQKELLELDIQITEARKHHIADPDNEEIEDELMAMKAKRKKLADEFEKYQSHLYDIALNFAKTACEKYSERMRKARELFELGDTIGADQILNMEEMKLEARNELKLHEQNLHNLETKIEEFRLKADTVMSNTLLTIPDRFTEACNAYDEALSIAKTIHFDDEKLAEMLFGYAHLMSDFNRMHEAVRLYVKVLHIQRQLAENSPETYRPAVARTLNNLGLTQNRLRRYAEAKKSYLEALEIRRELATSNPEAYRPDLALTLNNLANLQKDLGRYEDAKKNYKEALKIYLASSNSETHRSVMATMLNNLGILQYNFGIYKEAEEYYQEALEIRRELVSSNPEVYRSDLIQTLNNLGILQGDQGRFENAENLYFEALETLRKLVTSNPEAYRPDLALTLNNFGNLQNKLRRYADAKKSYQEALQTYRELAASYPEVYRPDVANTLNGLGNLYSDIKDYANAVGNYLEALQIYSELASSNPEAYRSDVAKMLHNLGSLQDNQGRFEDAERYYLEALQIYRDLASFYPEVYRPNVANTLNGLGILREKLCHYNDAEKCYQEALENYRILASSNPEVYRRDVATMYNNLGASQWVLGYHSNSERSYQKALEIYRELEENNPGMYKKNVETLENWIKGLHSKSRSIPNPNIIETFLKWIKTLIK